MKIKGSRKPSYDPGESVEYECRLGYKRTRSGTIQTVCQENGTWTALQESCTKKSCPSPAVPRNGEITNRNGSFLFGSEAHYACFEGFRLIGQEVIYCQLVDDTLDWSENPPLCEKVYCQPPEEIPNGKYNRKSIFEYNDVITYRCIPSNGSEDFSLIGPNKRVCSSNGEWSGTAPQCKVVVCPIPTVTHGIPKSLIPRKRYYNTKVIFECLPGFHLQGSYIVTCDADNNWKPALPTCVSSSGSDITTPTPPRRDHGSNPAVTTSTPATGDPGSKPSITSTTAPGDPGSKPSVTTSTRVRGNTGSKHSVSTLTPRNPDDASPSDISHESYRPIDTEVIVLIVSVVSVGFIMAGLTVYKYLQSRENRESQVSEASFSN